MKSTIMAAAVVLVVVCASLPRMAEGSWRDRLEASWRDKINTDELKAAQSSDVTILEPVLIVLNLLIDIILILVDFILGGEGFSPVSGFMREEMSQIKSVLGRR